MDRIGRRSRAALSTRWAVVVTQQGLLRKHETRKELQRFRQRRSAKPLGERRCAGLKPSRYNEVKKGNSHRDTETTFNAKLAKDAKVPIVRPTADGVGRAAKRNEPRKHKAQSALLLCVFAARFVSWPALRARSHDRRLYVSVALWLFNVDAIAA